MNASSSPARRAWHAVAPWRLVILAAIGGAAVVGGLFDPQGRHAFLSTVFALAVGLTLIGAGVLDGRERLAGRLPDRPLAALDGPLVWTINAWMMIRLGGRYAPDLFPLGAALVAWQVVSFPKAVHVWTVGAAVVLEVGLTASGRQDLAQLLIHLVMGGGAAVGVSVLARGEAWRRQMSEAREALAEEGGRRDRAREFGLLTVQGPAIDGLPGLEDVKSRPTVGRLTLDFLAESFKLQLDALRAALDLTTAVVLWRDPDTDALHLRERASTRDDLLEGPFAAGAGLPGSVLGDTNEVAVAPLSSRHGGLPYYTSNEGVGSALVLAVADPGDPDRIAGVLCLDRASEAPWPESAREAARNVVRKLSLDIATGRQLKHIDARRDIVARFSTGLQALNRSLSLEEVGAAAVKATRALADVDLVVVSLREGELHRVVRAEGLGAEGLTDLQFAAEEGLVGEAVRLNQGLPVNGDYRGNQAVFTAGHRLTQMRSLLILPLVSDTGAFGALTLASRSSGLFSHPGRKLFELVAEQVAVRLDLAQAHEKIRELATTDGLTGLNNHRTFQQAFDAMLNRAARRQSPLCFILTDIDRFKRLNDNYGHPFGDEVLKGVARVLKNAVRKVDLAARYGGEEFGLILEDSDEQGGMLLAERIRRDIEALVFQHESGPVQCTLSLGVAAFPTDGAHKAMLIERADKALYFAKDNGRNQAVAWSSMDADSPPKD